MQARKKKKWKWKPTRWFALPGERASRWMVLGVRGLGVAWLRPGLWSWSAKGSAGFAEEGSDRSELGLARSSEPEHPRERSRLKVEWHPSPLPHRIVDGSFRNYILKCVMRVKLHSQNKKKLNNSWKVQMKRSHIYLKWPYFFSRKKRGKFWPKIEVFLRKRCRGWCRMLCASREIITHLKT